MRRLLESLAAMLDIASTRWYRRFLEMALGTPFPRLAFANGTVAYQMGGLPGFGGGSMINAPGLPGWGGGGPSAGPGLGRLPGTSPASNTAGLCCPGCHS